MKKILIGLFVCSMFNFAQAADPIDGPSYIGENAKIIALVASNNKYLEIVTSEVKKADVGDRGAAYMRAVKVSENCGDGCNDRYLVLREMVVGHSAGVYSLVVLVDVSVDPKGNERVTKVSPVVLPSL